mgnify:CR=1 FL=1
MICTLTINPAMDRMIYLSEFSRGNTNRIERQHDALGGKGTHVSVNLGILQCKNRAFGIDFGETGLRIEEKLKNAYIDLGFLHYPSGNSRTNYALVEENGCCTLLSEKGKCITREECETLLVRMDEAVEPGDILVLSGDASNTEVPLFYIEVMDRFADRDVRIFLDSSSENLIEGLKRSPFLIKPNEDELGQILGRRIESETDVVEGVGRLAGMGIECIAVTCGGRGSYVWYQEELYRIHPLEVHVVNTIGCGDAFLSGMAFGFDRGLSFKETLRCAAAVSSATAESNSTVGFSPERAAALKDRVHIEKIV